MKTDQREAIAPADNPLGIEGLEFVEYETAKPQALGQVLETLGFRPVARHRSREVLLYRQGEMNVVVNAHEAVADAPAIAAFALRVRDAGAAHRHAVAHGAWPAPVEVQAMELHIPAIHGVGASRIYFVDRWREFSIWDVDFVPIPTVDARPPALAGLRWFGLVQYIGAGRTDDWSAFYRELFGWTPLPDDRRFGILPRGRVLEGQGLRLQLIEPEPGVAGAAAAAGAASDEALQRAAFGVPDVLAAVQALRARGVQFVETEALHPESRGAVTQPQLGGVMFELVREAREPGGAP
jgi:4-hydroxyphenylpyruvate dioxygenase